jgi:hypothetical protein
MGIHLIDTGAKTTASRRPRTRAEIRQALRRVSEKVWYARHIQGGRPAADECTASQIEAKYSQDELCTCERCDIYNEGSLTTLRWVLGQEWDCSDV